MGWSDLNDGYRPRLWGGMKTALTKGEDHDFRITGREIELNYRYATCKQDSLLRHVNLPGWQSCIL